jgi:hypothetical protein
MKQENAMSWDVIATKTNDVTGYDGENKVLGLDLLCIIMTSSECLAVVLGLVAGYVPA